MEYFDERDGFYDADKTFCNSVIRTVVNKGSPMYQFYKGLNIFITGASGFMGKVFIEKILRCFSDVNGIYILLRPKKNKSVEERLANEFKDELFDRLKFEQPGVLYSKVHIISGDLSQPALGISQEDQHFIQQNIHVIVHAAASLRMDELIKDAFTLNVQATKCLLDLAMKCSQLKAVIHVSTLYTHSYREDIAEQFYPTELTYDQMSQLIQETNPVDIEILTPLLFGSKYNNTYAFTKAIGESVVEQYMDKLPLAMVRPSIVVSTWKEPIVGWSNNFYGPNGAAAGAALGLIHTFYATHDKKCDLIPVDTATNMIISVIWKTSLDSKTSAPPVSDSPPLPVIEPRVYNLSTSEHVPITWLEFMNLNHEAGLQEEEYIASTISMWAYSFAMEQSKVMYILRVWFLHMIPGLLIDTVLGLMNKQPLLMKIYVKIMKFSKYFYPYVERDWRFGTSNIQGLLGQIPKEDYSNVEYELDKLSWRLYFMYYFRGGKLYVLKDSYDNMEKGRIHLHRMKKVHFVFLSFWYTVFAYALYKAFLYFSNTLSVPMTTTCVLMNQK